MTYEIVNHYLLPDRGDVRSRHVPAEAGTRRCKPIFMEPGRTKDWVGLNARGWITWRSGFRSWNLHNQLQIWKVWCWTQMRISTSCSDYFDHLLAVYVAIAVVHFVGGPGRGISGLSVSCAGPESSHLHPIHPSILSETLNRWLCILRHNGAT